MTNNETMNHTLVDIEKLLKRCGKSLHDCIQIPLPNVACLSISMNILVHDELRYDRVEMQDERREWVFNMIPEQHDAYNTIIKVANSIIGGVFFFFNFLLWLWWS